MSINIMYLGYIVPRDQSQSPPFITSRQIDFIGPTVSKSTDKNGKGLADDFACVGWSSPTLVAIKSADSPSVREFNA